MEERIRRPAAESGGPSGFGSIFDPASGGAVTIMNGPYAEQLPAGGMTVGEIRRRFGDRFDVDPQSLAVLDGDVVDDETVVLAGQLLRFSRRAGEKGSATELDMLQIDLLKERLFAEPVTPPPTPKDTLVNLTGPTVQVTTPELETSALPLSDVLQRLAPRRMSTEDVVLPDGVKAVLSGERVTIWVHQTPPGVHNFRWIAEDSDEPYGSGASYRDVKVALPYVVLLAVFPLDRQGRPQLRHNNECFFRNEPIRSLDDELLYPALLNCSKFSLPEGRPLSWLCTQHLDVARLRTIRKENERLRTGLDRLLHTLFDTAFNYSSDRHEGASWFTESRALDPRIASIEAWEEATREDPLFATQVDWYPTGLSVRGVAERIMKNLGGVRSRPPTSQDVARIVLNHGSSQQRAEANG